MFIYCFILNIYMTLNRTFTTVSGYGAVEVGLRLKSSQTTTKPRIFLRWFMSPSIKTETASSQSSVTLSDQIKQRVNPLGIKSSMFPIKISSVHLDGKLVQLHFGDLQKGCSANLVFEGCESVSVGGDLSQQKIGSGTIQQVDADPHLYHIYRFGVYSPDNFVALEIGTDRYYTTRNKSLYVKFEEPPTECILEITSGRITTQLHYDIIY